MPDTNIEINKLEIRKANLFKNLKTEFDKNYEGVMSFDYMQLIHEYCNHQCGIGTSYSERANEIMALDQEIDDVQDIVHLPKSRVALQYVNNLIKNGKIQTEVQINNSSEFLANIQKILEADSITNTRVEEEKNSKNEEHEKIAFLTEILDSWVIESSFEQYKNGQYRDAVLNAFVALGDLLRDKTGIALDGASLAGKVLSLKDPKLILSDIESESGRNDQIGFMQILQGSFTGIRNPKAHSIRHDLNEIKTVQYLILASLLARRIQEGSVPT